MTTYDATLDKGIQTIDKMLAADMQVGIFFEAMNALNKAPCLNSASTPFFGAPTSTNDGLAPKA